MAKNLSKSATLQRQPQQQPRPDEGRTLCASGRTTLVMHNLALPEALKRLGLQKLARVVLYF
jgi:hypothetical protein